MPNLGLSYAEKIQEAPFLEGVKGKQTDTVMQKMTDKCKKKAATGSCYGHES
ncbi:hypothetical protein Enr8_07570 [Blastopirellula retiformator]|uniref:Uncharacterized protein n=1 Tax=Blastopirellula retiformator TaxID=2527970 RepID=A0A5C5VMX6_9BACT|nr:hypothetical protein Enr8_07570 [Blastopirellula retiformator]